MVYFVVTLDGTQWNVEAQSIADAACKAVAEFGEDKVTLVAFGEEHECN